MRKILCVVLAGMSAGFFFGCDEYVRTGEQIISGTDVVGDPADPTPDALTRTDDSEKIPEPPKDPMEVTDYLAETGESEMLPIRPDDIVCLWDLAEGRGLDGETSKGFLGQIMFRSSQSSMNLEADGEVRIDLFDDQGTAEEQSKPLHRFSFSAEEWNVRLSPSSDGPAYSVFIPYVRPDVTNATCALRVRYRPKQGPTLISEFVQLQFNEQTGSSPADNPATKSASLKTGDID